MLPAPSPGKLAVRKFFLLLVLLAACSSSSPASEKTPQDSGADRDARSSPPKDAAADVIVDPKNCVPPGTPSNSAGVGGYCSPGGGQCDMVGPEGTAEICTADLAGTPAHDWYCTTPCSMPGQCGSGATCANTPAGSRCVPTKCLSLVPEAGVPDAEPDAPGDAISTDAHDGAAEDH
jgi:hypothetical protein